MDQTHMFGELKVWHWYIVLVLGYVLVSSMPMLQCWSFCHITFLHRIRSSWLTYVCTCWPIGKQGGGALFLAMSCPWHMHGPLPKGKKMSSLVGHFCWLAIHVICYEQLHTHLIWSKVNYVCFFHGGFSFLFLEDSLNIAKFINLMRKW